MPTVFTLDGLEAKWCCDPCTCTPYQPTGPLEDAPGNLRESLKNLANPSCLACSGQGSKWSFRRVWDVEATDGSLLPILRVLGLPMSLAGSLSHPEASHRVTRFFRESGPEGFKAYLPPEFPWVSAFYCYRRMQDLLVLLRQGTGDLRWDPAGQVN